MNDDLRAVPQARIEPRAIVEPVPRLNGGDDPRGGEPR